APLVCHSQDGGRSSVVLCSELLSELAHARHSFVTSRAAVGVSAGGVRGAWASVLAILKAYVLAPSLTSIRRQIAGEDPASEWLDKIVASIPTRESDPRGGHADAVDAGPNRPAGRARGNHQWPVLTVPVGHETWLGRRVGAHPQNILRVLAARAWQLASR